MLLCASIAVYANGCPKDYQLPGAEGIHQIPENVAVGLLIKSPAPKYPGVAKAARIQGTVVVAAVITTEGKLTSLKPLCGEPILIKPVLRALKDWRYKPYELDGKPVEVDTTIRTDFALGAKK